METDCDMIFWKSVRISAFQRLKFRSKIVEIFQNCSCSMDFVQEITFNHLARANYVLTNKVKDHFVNL